MPQVTRRTQGVAHTASHTPMPPVRRGRGRPNRQSLAGSGACAASHMPVPPVTRQRWRPHRQSHAGGGARTANHTRGGRRPRPPVASGGRSLRSHTPRSGSHTQAVPPATRRRWRPRHQSHALAASDTPAVGSHRQSHAGAGAGAASHATVPPVTCRRSPSPPVARQRLRPHRQSHARAASHTGAPVPPVTRRQQRPHRQRSPPNKPCQFQFSSSPVQFQFSCTTNRNCKLNTQAGRKLLSRMEAPISPK